MIGTCPFCDERTVDGECLDRECGAVQVPESALRPELRSPPLPPAVANLAACIYAKHRMTWVDKHGKITHNAPLWPPRAGYYCYDCEVCLMDDGTPPPKDGNS